MKPFFTALFALTLLVANAQKHPDYWQQRIDYTMDVSMNVEDFTYKGSSTVQYTNHSPDTLTRVFFHLYFNAFRPGSDMDARLQSISDPDNRMVTENKESRISVLSEDEMGYLRVAQITQNQGAPLKTSHEETILVVDLQTPLLPQSSTTLNLDFEGQVPLQIRRSGRNSEEGVALSMSQWYPKMVEYDHEGWHDYPYIAREFHGVWGDFDVKLTLDKNYTVAATGYLQNADEIGHGYSDQEVRIRKNQKNLTWHFKADNVHDFMWAADPEYVHDRLVTADGVTLHFFYKNKPELAENWKNLQSKTEEAMNFFNEHVGKYPYKQYSVVQGGDGGMEYAMATLITGDRPFPSLVGVMVHELAHSWFQHVLATNEGKHSWMDEGFTSYISSLCMNSLMGRNQEHPYAGSYRGYYALVESKMEEPQTTHSDRYDKNFAYSIAAYSKGSVFLAQLGYIIGKDALAKTLKRYYADYQFTHPTPNDFIRTAEKVSGAHLGWYLNDFTKTTKTIDYAIESVKPGSTGASIELKRIGGIGMPIDLVVSLNDGSQHHYYIPLTEMRAEKPNEHELSRTVLSDWSWAQQRYTFEVAHPLENIKTIAIDPSTRMADIDQSNNVFSQ
ncbi:MAG: M1 family metallopeptidase [Bacteroidetes bacterium]|nr:M1 family metallopeptidase [Bacteroidota bacterium]